jgi:hypothetical protein
VNLADDMMNLSQALNTVISKISSTSKTSGTVSTAMPKSKVLEYLISYHEFRYYFILHAFEKLID